MANSFTNTIVLITGAASGIGRQLAVQAAERGATVIATDRNELELEVTRQLAQNNGLLIQTHLLDVADSQAISQFAADQVPQFDGRKLVLINNAGVALSSGTFHDTSLEDFEWLLNINLWGTIRMTKAFYPYLIESNEGHIVNISSVFGLIGVALSVPYCTSKFGVRGFTESLRMELRGTGIGTTCVHPGGVKTNIVKNALVKEAGRASRHQKSVIAFERQARTTAESAAQQILNAVEKKKSRLVIGVDGWAIDWMSRTFPVQYTAIIKKQFKKAFGVDS
jgi:butyryl-CoA dehydrogenase